MSERTSPLLRQVGAFLYPCLRAFWDPPALRQVVAVLHDGVVDWAGLLRVGREEALSPLLYRVLQGRDIAPPEIEEQLRQAYYGVAGHNSLMLHELTDVLEGLSAEGVPALLVKGAALADTVYGDIGVRPMTDVDIMVPQGDVLLAQSVLVGLGYTSMAAEPWPGYSWRYQHGVQFQRPSGQALPFWIGLHSRPFDIPYYERIPVADWFSRALPAPSTWSHALIPSPEDHLVYLCGHLALHHQFAPGVLRLIDLTLVMQRSGRALDWQAIASRATDWHLALPVQRSLAWLEELWPATLPSEAGPALDVLQPQPSERRVYHWVVVRPRSPAAYSLLALATMGSWHRRVRFLAELAVPSPAYMRKRYCPQRPYLWPLMYLWRGALALKGLYQRLALAVNRNK